jgi:hypothetical protein
LTGVAIVFSTLFTKTWRINKVMLGGNTLRRSIFRAQDVLLPLALFLSLNVAILTTWTAAAPLTWEEQLYKNGEPGPYRGTCYQSDPTRPMFEAKIAFASVLVAINVVTLILTNYQFWLARRLPSDFNETYYMGITNVVLFECAFVGVPILVAFRDNNTIFVLVRCAVASLSCMGILLPQFLPKLNNAQRNASVRLSISRTPTIVWSSVSEFVAGQLRFRAPQDSNTTSDTSGAFSSGAFTFARVGLLKVGAHDLEPVAEHSDAVDGEQLEPVLEDSASSRTVYFYSQHQGGSSAALFSDN